MKLTKTELAAGIINGLCLAHTYYSLEVTGVGSALLLYFFLPLYLFAGGILMKDRIEAGKTNAFMNYVYGPLGVLVLVVDVVWNAVIGSITFLEFPREFLFTTRVQRHYDESEGKRFKVAVFWAFVLNAIDDGHIEKGPAL